MSLRIEENYQSGVPQTYVPGFAPRGLAWHWTAGATGRAGAESTIRHFQATRYTVNASYHILVWPEHTPGHLGCSTFAMWIVPAAAASHSMNPAHAFVPKDGSAAESQRFAEVHRILARDSDPNADCWSVSYCGMPADLAGDLKCGVFRQDLRELARQLIGHPQWIIDRPHFGHGWIQPTTRYEMDRVGLDFIAMLYGAEAPVEEDEEMTWVNEVRWYKTPKRATIRGGAAYRLSPNPAITPEGTLDDTGAYVAPDDETRILIGEVNGLDFGAGPLWYVIGGDNGVPKAVHSQDKIAESPLVTTVTEEVEVVKEVPTGITEEQVDEAHEDGVADEKARMRALLGL